MSQENSPASGRDMNGVDRRVVLAGASALGGAAALSATGLGRNAFAATPKKGGRLRLGVAGGGTTDTLDPGLVGDTVAMNINHQLRNNLVEILPNGQLGAELAES